MHEFVNKGHTYESLSKYQRNKADWLEVVSTVNGAGRVAYWSHLSTKFHEEELSKEKDLCEFNKQEMMESFSMLKDYSVNTQQAISSAVFGYLNWANKDNQHSIEYTQKELNSLFEVKESYESLETFYSNVCTKPKYTDMDIAMLTILRYGIEAKHAGLIRWEDIDTENKTITINGPRYKAILPIDNTFILVMNRAKSCKEKISEKSRIQYLDYGYILKVSSGSKHKYMEEYMIRNMVQCLTLGSNEKRIDIAMLRRSRVYDLIFEKVINDRIKNADINNVLKLVYGNIQDSPVKDFSSNKISMWTKRFEMVSELNVELRKTGSKQKLENGSRYRKRLKDEDGTRESKGTEFLRDKKIILKALKESNYKCNIDSEHITFTSEVTNKNYVEGHHLIPIKYYNYFEYSIDNEANICVLCPTCHRLLHHASTNEKEKVIRYLYKKCKDNLDVVGLTISESELINLYK